MRWVSALSNNIKRGIRSWLQIQPSSPYSIQIQETMDYELNAIRNRIWYRGDGNELEQLYSNVNEYADKHKFWASRCTPGMEMRKIHTGLPGMIVRILSAIVLSDMNDFGFTKPAQEALWKEIEKENKFRKALEKSLKEVLYIGDGAYKVTIDTSLSKYPMLEWYPGERVEIVEEHGRLKEVVFKTPYLDHREQYVLYEHYGHGYIRNELYRGENQVDIKAIEATKNISDWEFDPSVMLAVPLKIYESTKWEGRGGSIFDGKLDSFDAFDEAWSQWMDALRAGRARTYIPESYIPRDPRTGELLIPNPFDNRFIAGDDNMGEDGKNTINTEQPNIPHESYLASYVTALDLCLQGIISPSTLGIDVKKMDNAEAQREKEKATLYTRNAVVEALQEELPEVISACINAYHILLRQPVEEVKVQIPFGEYANPSFESQVETMSKARPGSPVMSIKAQVEEMWGDSKDDEWKADEVSRLKHELGIMETEEPNVAGYDGMEGAANAPETGITE
ncbi:MAG: capsid protein [Lacrimispora sphenoides]